MTFKKIETGIWKPENPEDAITGVLIQKESNVGANNSMLYTLEVETKPVGVWGSAVLDPLMLVVNPGDKVRIVYKGKGSKKGSNNPPKLFEVFVDIDDTPKIVDKLQV